MTDENAVEIKNLLTEILVEMRVQSAILGREQGSPEWPVAEIRRFERSETATRLRGKEDE